MGKYTFTDRGNMVGKKPRATYWTELQDAVNDLDDNKVDKEEFNAHKAAMANQIKSTSIDVKNPPAPLVAAVGDDSTDDTIALQAIMDYISVLPNGGVMLISDGIYHVKDLKYRNNVSIRGKGKRSILKAHSSCVAWSSVLECDGITGIDIDNVVFDGNKGVVEGDDQSGVFLTLLKDSTDINIRNCTYQNNGYGGVFIKNSERIFISNSEFLELDCGIITTQGLGRDIIIEGNYFDGANMSEPVSIYGLTDGYHTNVIIKGNIIKNHPWGIGIKMRATKGAVVVDNIIQNCGTGIEISYRESEGVIYNCSDIVIEGNQIQDIPYEGIILDLAQKVKCCNNLLSSIGTEGITAKYLENCVIVDNQIIDFNTKEEEGGKGIYVYSCQSCCVCNNKINTSYTSRSAIYLAGDGDTQTTNCLIESNVSTNANLPLIVANGGQSVYNTIIGNIGNLSGTDAQYASIYHDNIDPFSEELPTVIPGGDWWGIKPPRYYDTFYVDVPAEWGSGTFHVESMSGDFAHVGRVINIIVASPYYEFLDGTNLKLKTSPLTTPPEGTILSFVWDGAVWRQI